MKENNLPVESKGVEESRQPLHSDQNTKGHGEPHAKDEDEENNSDKGRSLPVEGALQGHLIQHLRQLGMGEREGPQSQVGCRVGDTTQTELDRVNDLVNNDISHVEWLYVSSIPESDDDRKN